MSRHLYKVAIVFSLAFIMVAFNHCGNPFEKTTALVFGDGAVTTSGLSPSYEVFSRTVYPITRAHCINCHTTQSPTSAHADVTVAHDAIINEYKVNFDNIPSSRLVRKLRDEQHNCWGVCSDNADEMEAAIVEWNEGLPETQLAPPDLNLYTAKSRALSVEFLDPVNTPMNGTITLSYDVSSLVGVSDVSFQIDVSDYDEFSYKLSNPRIKTPTLDIYVKNIRVLINGFFNPQHSLYTVVDKTTTPMDRILSTSAMIAIKDKGIDSDRLSFSFETLKVSTASGAGGAAGGVGGATTSYESFENSVWQVTRANCSSCHSGANPVGHASPNSMTAHDVVLDDNLVDFVTVTNSLLYSKLKIGRHNCGNTASCDAIAVEMKAAIEEWKTAREGP